MTSKPKTPKKEKNPVKLGLGALAFVAILTIVISILSIWIGVLRALLSPIAVVLGIALLVMYLYARKGSFLAFVIGTAIYTSDAVLTAIFMLSNALGLAIGGIFVRLCLSWMMIDGVRKWPARPDDKELLKGIGIGVGAYIAFIILSIFLASMLPVSYSMPTSAIECIYSSGDKDAYDNCIFAVVVKSRDATLCNKITNPDTQLFCRSAATYNSSMCEVVGGLNGRDAYNVCMAMTSRVDARSYCYKVSDGALRDECLALVG